MTPSPQRHVPESRAQRGRIPSFALFALLLLSAALCVVLLRVEARADGRPSRWQAFMQLTPPTDDPLLQVVHNTPEVVLFDDGRLVWLDTLHWRVGDGQNPCAWRTAVLSVRERIDFRQIVEGCEFYRIQLPTGTVADSRPGVGSVRIAARTGGERDVTVYARYAPESLGSRRFVMRMFEVMSALRVLTQRVNECYDADIIRVGAVPAEPVSGAPDWPVAVAPTMLTGHLVEYRGDDARRVIDTLAKSSAVTINGHTWRAAWAPVFDVPPSATPLTIVPPVPASPTPAPSPSPEVQPSP